VDENVRVGDRPAGAYGGFTPALRPMSFVDIVEEDGAANAT